MPKMTAFHPRLEPLNETKVWKNWSGFLVAPQFKYSLTNEYYAIRSSVSLLDTSPLFKYRISGSNSVRLLERIMSRDIKRCKVGGAQYTVWSNENGFVIQDGVILRTDEFEFYLTAGEPTLRYFNSIAREMQLDQVTVEDVSEAYGILALQGPHAHNVISQLSNDATDLKYFDVANGKLGDADVIISRTGYTGDLGYEIWVPQDKALTVWDSLMKAGEGYNIAPIGTTALKMARVEAGLLLMGVDFDSSRFAWVDAQRETAIELGWSWMFRNLEKDDRDFIGRRAIEAEIKNKTSRWKTVGLEIDWHSYEAVHLEAGILPPKSDLYRETTMSIYRRSETPWEYAGYATSFLFSSLLRKPIAIAKLPLDLTGEGTEVDLEVSVIRKPVNVLAKVTSLPFFNPERKTALMGGGK